MLIAHCVHPSESTCVSVTCTAAYRILYVLVNLLLCTCLNDTGNKVELHYMTISRVHCTHTLMLKKDCLCLVATNRFIPTPSFDSLIDLVYSTS